jgi:hypothetical protein
MTGSGTAASARGLWVVVLAAAVQFSGGAGAAAAAPAPPKLVSVSVTPARVLIDRPQAAQQLLVTGRFSDGSLHDLTGSARFRSRAPSIATVTPQGVVTPGGNGSGTVSVVVASGARGLALAVPVRVRNAGVRYRWDFASQIVPLLTRAGCNGASCHGSASGRGGFKLAAFGGDAGVDFAAITRWAEGRRLNRADPAHSLLLLKPTMTVPHGGGLRFKVGSPEYRMLASWIASGAPEGGDGPRVSRLEVWPRERLLTRAGERQRLLVTAHYTDGTREDVSERALFEAKNEAAATVDGSVVTAAGIGDTPVIVRYAGLTAAATISATTLPPLRGFPVFDPANVVDREVFGKLRRLRLQPAPAAEDAELVRRLYLDVVGRIPTAEEAQRFVAETDPVKRARLVETLLEGPEYPRHWRDNLNGLLMGRGAPNPQWTQWLETSLREDHGWDRMAREILLARPESASETGALVFLNSRFGMGDTGLDQVTRDVSRIFFGVDIQCARCHTHPAVASWQQEAYWGLSAFYARSYLLPLKSGTFLAEKATGEVQYFGTDKNQRSAAPVFLTGERPDEPRLASASSGGMVSPGVAESAELYLVPPEEAKEKTRVPVPKYSRRARFVELAVGAQDPYFTRAIVNRVWAMLMGRGLVEPVDQMHAANPASHPALLDALANGLAEHRFSLKWLIRAILTSRTYALGSRWGHGARPGAELYAVAAVRPMTMAQLANSTLVGAGYWEQGDAADLGKRRAQLETGFAAQLAELRQKLDSGTEVFQANVSQALYLANSRGFETLIDKGPLVERLAKVTDDGEAVRQAYLAVLSRPPDEEELGGFRKHLAARGDRRRAALQQMVWALLASVEFRFVH